MKFIFTLILIISIPFIGLGQAKKNTYIQFEIVVPIKGNPNYNVVYANGEKRNASCLLSDGIASELGFGFHKNKWIALGIQSGVFWKAIEKLVAVPVYANFRLSPSSIYVEN